MDRVRRYLDNRRAIKEVQLKSLLDDNSLYN
jgi:hypothetical protein